MDCGKKQQHKQVTEDHKYPVYNKLTNSKKVSGSSSSNITTSYSFHTVCVIDHCIPSQDYIQQVVK